MTDANASPEMILDAKERILNLRRVLRSPNLGDRERDLLDRHILADEPISLPDWAESVGVTRQRGHQIKVSALAKIRQLLEDLDNAEMQRRRNAFRSKRLAAKISIQETIGRQLCAFDAFMLSDIRRNWHKRGCNCGTKKVVRAGHVASGKVVSCGCWRGGHGAGFKRTLKRET